MSTENIESSGSSDSEISSEINSETEAVGQEAQIGSVTATATIVPAEADTANQSLNQPDSKASETSKSSKSWWPIIGLVMLIIGGIVGWRIYTQLQPTTVSTTPEAELTQPRLPVRAVRAETGLAQDWVFDEGTALPVNIRVLNFYDSGDITYVAKLNGVELKEGDRVRRGQLLAQIDDRRQTASIATADADIEVAVNQQQQSQALLRQAQANLDKATSDLALARTELQRYQSLFAEGAVSASDRDVYRNRVDQAQAALEVAQEEINSAQDGVRSADSSITAAQARRQQTDVDLEDTQLVSPIDGLVAYINIQEGEYWSTQYLDTTGPQELIETAPIVVFNPDTFEVELEIQADAANAIRAGQRAYVVLEEAVSSAQAEGANQQDLLAIAQTQGSEGRVFAVSPSQTPGSRGTKVTIRDFETVQNLKVGGRVYVWIETVTNPNAIVLPLGAVLARDQNFYAFVIDEATGTVQRRQVERGVESLAGVEVLSGVAPNELIVIEGQNRLVNGTPVEIVNMEAL